MLTHSNNPTAFTFNEQRARVASISVLDRQLVAATSAVRPKKLADPKQLALARRLYEDGQTDIATIFPTLGTSHVTLYRSISTASRSAQIAPK